MILTQESAEARGLVIKLGSISYDFHIWLQQGDSYTGFAEIAFELLSIPSSLHLDFNGKSVSQLVVNQKECNEYKIEECHLLLDTNKLKVGQNIIGVHYSNSYDNDGNGCMSFVDVDGKQYIYTQFEPYEANRVFPCFDQPDLKASMRLYIISPQNWKKIISNECSIVEQSFDSSKYYQNCTTKLPLEVKKFLIDKSGKMTIFPVTKLLPTYLYCFVAGDYQQLKLEQSQRYNNVPMSLYCIESLFPYLKGIAPFVFEITKESMRFYQSYFGYSYPFSKFDQVFAHQFKCLAMENAGIVTYKDSKYVFKENVSEQLRFDLAITITHELSHHWFGNLVTMKWWDDLWLNESFADFISYFCLEKIRPNIKLLKYQSSMATFLQSKTWGYDEDQMVTTHPIRAKVENTSVAQSIFDGITYSKGAATMKQMLFLMNQDNFSKGLTDYFKLYQWRNATIEDFLQCMQKHFTVHQFTLVQWREMWLQKESLNIIEPFWNVVDNSPNSKLILKQTPFTKQFPTLRLHKMKIGLFKEDFKVDTLDVLVLPQEQNIIQYDGSKGYKALLLNFEDHAFAKCVIDPISLDFFKQNLNKIEDLLTRMLIWRSLFEMVQDAKIASRQFIEIVIKSLAEQKSDSIFENQLNYAEKAINVYTPEAFREELDSSVFKAIYDLLSKISEEQQNRIVILKNSLLNFANSKDEKTLILNWKDGEDQCLKKYPLTVEQTWKVVVKAFTLANLSIQQKQEIFKAQLQKDSSDTSKNHRLTCDALKSNEEEFEKIYLSLKDKDSKLSIYNKRSVADGWNHGIHRQRLAKYRDQYFEDIEKLVDVLNSDHLIVFYKSLQPIDDDLAGQIKKYGNISFPVGKERHSRDILKIVDLLKRRQKAYKLYENVN